MPPPLWDVKSIHGRLTQYFREKGVEVPRIASEILVAHALKLDRIGVYTRHDLPVDEGTVDALRALARRHAEGEPLAFLVGKASFFSFELEVERGVFCPRPETELLVEFAAGRLRSFPPPDSTPRVLDLGCGTGAVGLSLAKLEPRVRLVATDISERAIQLARRNAVRLGVADRVEFRNGDLFDGLDGERFDALVSNPPYIPSGQIPGLERAVRDYDPAAALDGGPDGLRFYRAMAADSPRILKPGGILALELGIGQHEGAASLLEETGAFHGVECFPDLSGIPRVLLAVRSA